MKKISFILLLILSLVVFNACDSKKDDDHDPVQIQLKVTSNDESMGVVEGSGTYIEGSYVSIRAIPNDGFIFVSWNDGDTNLSREVLVEGKEYIAVFESKPLPTAISAIFGNFDVSWGDTSFSNSNQQVSIWYNNGDTISVHISELNITNFSSDTLGVNSVNVSYNGFNYNLIYNVYYTEVDISHFNFKTSYVVGEEIQYNGYIIGKGLNNKSEIINVSELDVKGFDSSHATTRLGDNRLSSNEATFIIPNYKNSYKIGYSVWYTKLDATYYGSSEINGKGYRIKISDFKLETDGTFEMLLEINEDTQIKKTIYRSEDFSKFTWAEKAGESEEITLFYKSGILGNQTEIIGTYYYTTNKIILKRNVFGILYSNNDETIRLNMNAS